MAITNYTATTTTGEALAAAKRVKLIISNTGANPVFINFGAAAEVNKGIYLAASGGTFTMDTLTLSDDAVNAITSSGTTNLSIYYETWV